MSSTGILRPDTARPWPPMNWLYSHQEFSLSTSNQISSPISGRDYMPCCRRPSVALSCSSLYQVCLWPGLGQHLHVLRGRFRQPAATPPVLEVEAARLEDNVVLRKWRIGDNVTNVDHYEVFYKHVTSPNQTSDDLLKTQYQINSIIPMVLVDNLTNNKLSSWELHGNFATILHPNS